MKISGIYQIVNKINHKTYIGSTASRGFSNRFNTHKWELRKGKHTNKKLQNAWNKYGEDAFYFGILQICEKNDVLQLEQAYIDLCSPFYNIAKSTTAPMTGRKLSKASRTLIALKNTGSKNGNFGKVQPISRKLKNIKSNKGSLVVCSETGEMFFGAAEAARKLGLNRQNISSVLHGRLKSTGHLTFFRVEI